MRACLVLLASVLLFLPACSSDGSGGGSRGGAMSGVTFDQPDIGDLDDADAVSGNVRVIWKNLNPEGAPITLALVNASSDTGQKLRSGRMSSTQTRVITDEQMGVFLAKLDELGFNEHATAGLGLDNLPSVSDKRGVVVVQRDGRTAGLLLTLNMGPTAIPKTYRDTKAFFLAVHGQAEGLEIKTNTDDAERLFQSPPAKMRMR